MRISIIIPVYNEEGTIGGLLNCLKDSGADELLVADGGSVDRTVEIASRHAQIIHAKIGRAIQMNTAARCATGDVLLFLHADVRLGATALGLVRKVMADPVIVGELRYSLRRKDWAATTFTHINRCGGGAAFLWRLGIFCRRSAFDSLGGFVSWPILEDYEFVRGCGVRKMSYLNERQGFPLRRWRRMDWFRRWRVGSSFSRSTMPGFRRNTWPASISTSGRISQ
jgi:glycosyltransferase involved in cell wall biosynthesis